jgi:hypothetical protein
MHTHDPEIPDLDAVFDAAVNFGLTEDEVLQTVSGAMLIAGQDTTVHEYLDELTEALTQRILWKQRRVVAQGRL